MTKTKGEETKQRMLDKTAELLRTQGYHGTGLKQILEESNTPRGSLYFHFPGGKEELAAQAAAGSGAKMQLVLRDLASAAATPRDAIDGIIDRVKLELVESQWKEGCPVATLALEMSPYSEPIQEMCAETFRGWEFVISSLLERSGMDASAADDMATFVLSAIEGAILLSRTHRSVHPLENARLMLHRTVGSHSNVALAAAE